MKTGRGITGAALLAVVLTVFCIPHAFAAAKEKSLGTFGSWNAYASQEGGQTVCYMVTTRLLQTTGPKKRAQPYLMITHRPTEASTDVVSYGAGTLVNSRRGVKLTIGKSAFELFSVRDTAWARDSLTDHKIASALKTAPVAQAASLPSAKKSRPMTDHFDLTGAGAAYQAIGKACGLPGFAPKKPAPKKHAAGKRPPPHRSNP